MLLKADGRVLVIDQPQTVLTASVTAGGVTLTVASNNGFSISDYVLVGKIGDEKTEIKRITGAVTAGTSLTVAALTYNHDGDTQVTKLDYNQVCFWRSATTTTPATTATQLTGSPMDIDPTDIYTYYEDTVNQTGYGFLRYYDSNLGNYSAASDAIPYTGYTAKMLRKIRSKVRRLLNETDELNSPLSNEEIDDEINIAQKEIAHDRLWSFYEKIKSFSTVANQYKYSLASDVFVLYDSAFDTQPLIPIDTHRFTVLRWDSDTSADPTHISMWRREAYLYPYPSSSADTTTLNGGITAAATTITVVSTSGFDPQGRFIIDSEVISYTGLTSTTFTGCVRGEEETTAATHLTAATVTKRDIIYHFQEEPVDLANETDVTAISEPAVISYRAATELALNLNNETLHDRLLARYERAMAQIRKVDEPKIKSSFGRVKDLTGRLVDPNNFPQNLS